MQLLKKLLTLFYVRSDISYIEGFDGSDIDDLIKLVATLRYSLFYSIFFVT